MFRITTLCSLLLLFSFSSRTLPANYAEETIPKLYVSEAAYIATAWYADFGLEDLLPFDAFQQALQGYQTIDHPKKEILTIIDYSKPSTEERMFVLDMKNQQILFQTVVAHGRNSGGNYATEFSNRHGSFQSSLGFFRTAHTYQGGNGYSLVIEGLEKGINDQARPRAVVIHGADYCTTDFINQNGRLGRSHGCPALPRELNQAIIDTIKDGSLLYIYADNEEYELSSTLFDGTSEWAD